ncbi:type II toxin-antitoxin system antitoxin SocA domain-containing protein [Porphyromonas gingivalis]|uniref:type II toxin-antitoxin system antitoxin SocA domain-containing protein n=1 Tax=Porphyromonas gingivalis TaxID=837 RepID=UPI000BE72618|nr:type II toxin-antitoxin system antitoxin SocA domain-containing protein [Porphyromonas gingivalis]PDP73025.1 hypothetical protein CLI81_06210 [Porphyromonas gingivalis]
MEEVDYKKLLFEYIVYQLVLWAKAENVDKPDFSKLRLQKILFLVSTIKATKERHGLLGIFNKFYALPYGPVESTIYDAMSQDKFHNINFSGNNCSYTNLNEDLFTLLKDQDKKLVEESISDLKLKCEGGRTNHITIPVFELVEITHRWTVWQVAMSIANMLGGKSETMSTEEILNSKVKAYF